MKGYKVFEPDWTCRGFQYSVGKTFEENVIPLCCRRGFHFCTELKDCFRYYPFDPNNKVAEIETLGEINTGEYGNKHCTNKIKIIRELSWEEVLKGVNKGKANTGRCNTGDRNSGNGNSGNGNSGDENGGNCNSGNCNTGDSNSGDWNSGYWNSGNYNSGNWNTGDCNSGYCNSGDWNKTDHSSGCFNTKEAKILMFNKPSDWTFNDWHRSRANWLLNNIQYNTLKWVLFDNMTEEEKVQHPECEITGGYLKKLGKFKGNQLWWDSLPDCEKNIIKSLPNFDAKIFKEITGIDVNVVLI